MRLEGWDEIKKGLRNKILKNYPVSELYAPSMNYCIEAGADAYEELLCRKGISTNPFRTSPNPISVSNPHKNGKYVFIPEDKK